MTRKPHSFMTSSTHFIRPLILISFCFFVYFLFFILVNFNRSLQSPYPYFTFLTRSFFEGRLDVSEPYHDLSYFNGKWYLYWGPSPVLFIASIYPLGGLWQSDLIYTLLAGMANVLLFYFLINRVISYFKLSISSTKKTLLLLHFAFATPNFYLSLSGRIWHTAEIIATTYLLLFFICFFLFMRSKYRLLPLFFTALFFNLAWTSRYLLIFHGLLFLLPFFPPIVKEHLSSSKRYVVIVAGISGLAITTLLLYNAARFGNPMETGLRYHFAEPRYLEVIRQGNFFSIEHIPHNIWYIWLNPDIRNNEGSSIFITIPLLLIFFFLIKKPDFTSRQQSFLLIASIIVCIHLFGFLLYFATGWKQFGNRYFLDLIPILFAASLPLIEKLSTRLLMVLLLFGIIINVLGVFLFYGVSL